MLSVPFGIDRRGGKIGLVKDVGPRALDHYLLKVQAEHGGKTVVTEIRINLVNDTKNANKDEDDIEAKDMDDAEEEQIFHSEVFKVKENLEGALVANLSRMEFLNAKNGFKEYFITDDEEAKEKFSITDTGLLYTKVALDREVRDSYDVVIVNGRGILRGRESIRVIMTFLIP